MAKGAAYDFNERGFSPADDQCPVIDLGFAKDQRRVNVILFNDAHFSNLPHLKGTEGKEDTWRHTVDGRDVATAIKNLAVYLKDPHTPLDNKIPTVIIINGDMICKGTREEELNRLEEIVGIIKEEFAGWPVIFSAGNHDQHKILPHEYEAITGCPARSFGLIAGSWHIPVINPVYSSVPNTDIHQNNHYLIKSHFDQLKDWARSAAKKTSDMFVVCHTNLKSDLKKEDGTNGEKLPHYITVSGWNAYEEANTTTLLIRTRTAFSELVQATKEKISEIFCAHKHEDNVTELDSGTRRIAAAFSAVMMPRRPEYFDNPADFPMMETAGHFTVIKARKDGLHVESLSLAGLSAAPQNIAPAGIDEQQIEPPRIAAE